LPPFQLGRTATHSGSSLQAPDFALISLGNPAAAFASLERRGSGYQMPSEHSYDYIIIGGGSAGCVLASRLSEDPHTRVLLLEAGGRDFNPLIHIPIGLGKLHEYKMHDWGYQSEPDPNLNGRRVEEMRGKVLGGSSSINVMAFTRGDPADYDRWAQKGARGWSYADVLPYFKRVENWQDGESEFRGTGGNIGVQWAKTKDPMFTAWIESARMAGLPVTDDYNSASGVGFGRSQYSIRDGKRCSAAVGYLHPAMKRKNLSVEVRALVSRITMQGKRATGVEYEKGGQVLRALAACEVILCGGSFNSPQVLMLSGIGPADHLRSVGIEPVIDLPVGKNLQDHLAVLMMYSRPEGSEFREGMRLDRIALSMLRGHFFGSGPATVVPGGLHAFIKTRPELSVPDVEFMFRGAPPEAALWFPGWKKRYADGYGIRPCLLHPDSRGEVLLRSSNPNDKVKIVTNFLTAPNDLPILRQGVRIAREVAAQPPLAPFRGVETSPGPKVQTDAEIDSWIRNVAATANHPASTCMMGTGPGAVVDPQFRVHGVEQLRVVDASAMPDLVSAHINACVLMMAEKASDLIRGKPALAAAA
jgi:choline dehydrogenase-like flavoprotein